MGDNRRGQRKTLPEAVLLLAGPAATLTSPFEPAMPEPLDLRREALHGSVVSQDTVVAIVTAHHAREPLMLLSNRLVNSRPHLLPQRFELPLPLLP